MLNPRRTQQFTRDIYDAVVREIERLEALPTLSNTDRHRLEVTRRWRGHLEADTAVDIEIKRFPPWPIRL